jgi:hypothetical protein
VNRVRVAGTWHYIDDLNELHRVHSMTYTDGHVWQIAFGSTILELSPTQAIALQAVCAGIDDTFMEAPNEFS